MCYYVYMYKFETSFTNISGSNWSDFNKIYTAISVDYTEAKYKFSRDFNYFINLLILDFKWYSDLLEA